MLLILAALAFSFSALPAHAVPITEPIVFDFEDGLQGWELGGSAQRVQTQILGGEWAIFADGFLSRPGGVDSVDGALVLSGTFISRSMDLTDIASISVEQFFIDGDEEGLLFFRGIVLIENIAIGNWERLEIIEPGNPSLRAFDVSSATGVREIGFFWGFVSESVTLPPIVGFTDNITLHPVPEPSTLALLLLGTGLIVIARRQWTG